jgi:16S rRNA C1402 N4-methylase RsmH
MTDHRSSENTGAARGKGTVFSHEPVMLAEVLDVFSAVHAGVIVDATLGGAGHSRAILEAQPAVSVLGLERDRDALDAARRALAPFGDRAEVRRSSFDRLAEVVRDAIPAPARRRGGHPAKRTFQALRIAVNRELDQLPGALDDAIALLAPHGRGAVLSYHSGEDRIVKDRFRRAETGGCVCPPNLPCACGAVPAVRLLWRSGRKPSAAEAERNPRAESARLRAVEKLDPATTGPRR